MGERVGSYSTWQEAFVDVKAHAKSNTKQIAEMKGALHEIADKLDRNGELTTTIKAVVVDDGLVSAIKRQAADLTHIREEFTEYQLHRMTTCPVAKSMDRKRDWSVTLIKLIFAGIGATSTILVIINYVRGIT